MGQGGGKEDPSESLPWRQVPSTCEEEKAGRGDSELVTLTGR